MIWEELLKGWKIDNQFRCEPFDRDWKESFWNDEWPMELDMEFEAEKMKEMIREDEKWDKRDKKRHKARHGMGVSGRSVKLLEEIQGKKNKKKTRS